MKWGEGVSFAVYVIPAHYGNGYIREQDDDDERLSRRYSDAMLEDEIDRLRARMVKLVMTNHALTSDQVVEVSRMLDEKINQYMQRMEQKRRRGH